MKKRLISLIRVLASPGTEIVGEWWCGDNYIDSIELTTSGFNVNMWSGSLELQLSDEDLTPDDMMELIEQLEQILLN